MEKTCVGCQQTKGVSEFTKDKRSSGGVRALCKLCHNKRNAARRKTNPEAERASKKRQKEKNPLSAPTSQKAWREKNREKLKADKQRWAKANPILVKEGAQRYYSKNKERIAARNREYAKSNPEKCRAKCQKRRALKIVADGFFSPEEWLSLCQRFGFHCACCGEEKPLHADHVIPLSKGGSNDIGNIQPLCKKCNSIKGTKDTDYRKKP